MKKKATKYTAWRYTSPSADTDLPPSQMTAEINMNGNYVQIQYLW